MYITCAQSKPINQTVETFLGCRLWRNAFLFTISNDKATVIADINIFEKTEGIFTGGGTEKSIKPETIWHKTVLCSVLAFSYHFAKTKFTLLPLFSAKIVSFVYDFTLPHPTSCHSDFSIDTDNTNI